MPKPDRPELPTYCVRHGLRVTTDSTALTPGVPTRMDRATALISALSQLITALTAAAVLLSHLS